MNWEPLPDLISSLFWLCVIIWLAYRYQKRRLAKRPERVLFWLAGLGKLLGALGFGLFVMIIQKQGDVWEYHRCLELLWGEITEDPSLFGQFLWAGPGDPLFPYHIYFTQGSPLAVIKIGLILGVFSFNNFWGTSVILAGLGFGISWQLYLAWGRGEMKNNWWGAFCLFFLPSVLFWGSGWSKDGLIWLAVCMILFSWVRLVQFPENAMSVVKHLLVLLVGAFLLTYLKPPLLGLAIASVGIGILVGWTRQFSLPMQLGMLGGFLLLGLILLFWQETALAQFFSYFQWHAEVFEGGQSAFDLPEIGRIRYLFLYLPYLALSGLFSPAPWEWSQPMVAIGGIEVLVVLGALFIWIRQRGWKSVVNNFLESPFSLTLLIFSLGLAVAAILFSQNFGTLFRYRTPALLLFLLSFWPRKKINSG